jgi:phospholipase D1/2
LLREGENCWRIAHTKRAAFLIDVDAYFSAFRQAVSQARDTVFILGWDIDSRVRLNPGSDEPPVLLLPFLNDVLARRPELRVFALAWDFSVIFTLERELLPAFRFAWNAHPRLSFVLDDAHPFSGSHHEKIVVVDDMVAFAGGVDLAIRRWDRPAHDARDPARVDPDGVPYLPMHDVHMIVDGDAAAALGERARARWQRATGHAPPPANGHGRDHVDDPWPETLAPDVRDAPIGIARTIPELDGRPAVREIATLTLESIAAARRFIYAENQYLTSAAVGSALARRLQEPDGPEVVLVLPREEHGWLEQSSMGVLRARVVQRLLDSDHHKRLRLFFPTVPGLGNRCVNVHDKVMIIDDRVARVGSANLSNRSMGLDTECDLVLDADIAPALQLIIAQLRNRLLAEHLGTEPGAVADAVAARGSLIAAVDALRDAGGPDARTLAPLPRPDPADSVAAPATTSGLAFLDGLACDPERPAHDQLLATFVPTPLQRPVRRSLAGWAIAVAAVAAVVAVWRMTPLASLADAERLAALGATLASHPAAPAIVLAGYVAGALVFFPITLLLGATALVFPAPTAVVYCLCGALSSAATTYAIGRLVGRFRPRWLAGPRAARVHHQLHRRGTLAIIAARLLPVGNFSLINIIAGALGIPFGKYMLGNAIGLLPGVLALTIFADRLGAALRKPQARNFIVLAIVAIILFALMWSLRRRMAARRRSS